MAAKVMMPPVEEVHLVPNVTAVEKELPPVPEEEVMKPDQIEEALKDSDEEKVALSGSFREESTRISDLSENEKKAFQEFKKLVQDALNKHEFSAGAMPLPPQVVKEEKKEEEIEKREAEKEKEEEKEETFTVEGTEQPPADVADDDGAKTVEAIEETIVAVSSSAQPEQPPAAEEKSNLDSSKESKTEAQIPPEQVSIWGIPLLSDDRSDVILLKFLRARDFKAKDAFTMLKNTISWRKEFGIEELVELEQDLGDDLENVVFMYGSDKDGHPMCYNVYGEFKNKELYQKTFSDEEKRKNFLKWRIQFLEKSIRKLDFTPGGTSTIVQVNDLKNSPGPGKWELRQATKQALQLLQDNYPEFVAKQVFINVPWWYLAVNKMISPFLTQRTRSKFVFSGPSKSAETLFRYIAAEQVPVKYGGLSKYSEFSSTDSVAEITLKSSSKHTVEFSLPEACLLTWEVRVVGWDVSYSAEFVPLAEDSYTVIIQKARKVGSDEEPVVCGSFGAGEPGKVVLTIDNVSSKKKVLLYRWMTKPTFD